MNKFKINITSAGRATVEMNGKELKGVTAIRVGAGVREATNVQLTLLGGVQMTVVTDLDK